MSATLTWSFDALSFYPVINHHVTEWAGGGDSTRPSVDEFLGTFVVDFCADSLFHPHASTTSSAAHSLGSVSWSFNYLDPLNVPITFLGDM